MADKKVVFEKTVRHFLIGDGASARDIASEINMFKIAADVNIVEVSTFDSKAVAREGGLVSFDISFEGYTVAGDDFERPASHFTFFIPDGVSQLGDAGYFGDCIGGQYQVTGKVGEAESFTLSAASNGLVHRGPILRNAYKDSAGASAVDVAPATGAEVEIGTVAADRRLYAAAFLLAFTGTSITFGIETDATGFAAPTERLSLGPLTAPSAAFASVAGPITPDDFVRVVTTGTFTSATFLVVAAVAKQ